MRKSELYRARAGGPCFVPSEKSSILDRCKKTRGREATMKVARTRKRAKDDGRTCGVEEVDLESEGTEYALPGVEVLDGRPVLVAEALAKEPPYDGALADAGPVQHHEPDPLVIRRYLVLPYQLASPRRRLATSSGPRAD